MKCTLLLFWDAASNPGTDFIIHHPMPHNRQLFLFKWKRWVWTPKEAQVTRTGENGESVPQWYFWGRQVSSRQKCDPVTFIKGAVYQGRMTIKTSAFCLGLGHSWMLASSNTCRKTHQPIHLAYVTEGLLMHECLAACLSCSSLWT